MSTIDKSSSDVCGVCGSASKKKCTTCDHIMKDGACENISCTTNVKARHNLGIKEDIAGNMERALKHHMIAASGGDAESVKEIQEMYRYGHATKEDYTKALQSYQAYLGEIKSPQRDKAAASYENCRYY